MKLNQGHRESLIKRFRASEEGATSVVLAISLTAIVGAFGLMTEVGFWRYKKSNIQTTADMAALAGAYQYIIEHDNRDARIAAFADASDNSFDASVGSLTVHIPPVSGDYVDEDAIQVVITQEIPTFISHMFSSEAVTTTVTAVAKLGGQSSLSCVLSLAETGTSISVGGNVTVNLNGCGIHANSTGSNAINAFGNVTITAACLSAGGGIDFSGRRLNLDECSAPRENQPEIVDPYADVDVPAGAAGMTCQYAQTIGNGNNRQVIFPPSDPSVNGGYVKICNNNLSIRGIVDLAPGTYIFDGTQIDFASHGQLLGDDVTLIFMNDAEVDGVNGNNTINLSAPTTGDYAGIVMYGDRNTMSNANWDFQGNADISFTGVLYLPTLDLEYAGGAGSNSTECTQIVANTVRFRGNSGLNSNCDAWATRDIIGGAFTTVQLVE